MTVEEINIELPYTQPQLDIFFPDEPKKYTVVTKGRRFGATNGAAHAYIEKLAAQEGPFLWGDTTYANIKKYFERYFKPMLIKNKIDYKWNLQDKQLTIGNQYMDFRSADQPENWEGFGYKEIFLNEAGIILNNDYLYTNAILPMLLDFSDSRVIAAGVPKGKYNKENKEHKFYTLYKQAKSGAKNYSLLEFTSYDNPLLNPEDIKELESEMALMDPETIRQEIYGEFTDPASSNPFATQYDSKKHEQKVKFNPQYPIHFSIDFNYNPFALVVFQMYRDSSGDHCYIVDEMAIEDGTIDKLSEEIRGKYGAYLHLSTFTGDYGGTHKRIGKSDNKSLFSKLKQALNLRKNQFKLHPNPTHKTSRSDCNYFLMHFPDFKINPDACPSLCRDMKVVQVDSMGQIIKRNRKDMSQLSDHLDCWRYIVNTHYKDWIKRHERYSGLHRKK